MMIHTDENLIRILLIEDDEDDFFLTKELLEEITDEKIHLEWADNHKAGLKKLKEQPFHICLLDYRLGSVSGLDVLKTIRSKYPNLPVIILTGKGDREIDKKAMISGATDYLIKGDIKASLLERTIRYAIERANHIKTIKESENKYKNIFYNSGDAILMIDKNFMILEVNPVAKKMLDIQETQLSNLSILNFFKQKEKIQQQFNTCLERKSLSGIETEVYKQNGEKTSVLMSLTLQDNAETDQTFLMMLHDISKRKMAEKLIRQTDKLSLTGRLARTIAHEIRNPLTNIQLSCEQLKVDLSELNADQSENADTLFTIIDRNSNRIQSLVTELLNSSKPGELKLELCDLNEITNDSLTLAKDRLTLNKIKLKTHFEKNLPKFKADREKLKTAILNILINATEAMEPGFGLLEIQTFNEPDHLVLTIKDNGSGMIQEDLHNLFDPFFSKKPKGIGLGLTTTHNIITNHKGTIEVDSEIEKGTVFVIRFEL